MHNICVKHIFSFRAGRKGKAEVIVDMLRLFVTMDGIAGGATAAAAAACCCC